MLGENMIGIYLFGSLVLGDFDENFSDIDLMIILKRDINKDEFEKIQDLQKYISEKYSKFATDGMKIDVYLGSSGNRKVTAVGVTVDFLERDSEIKVLIDCTNEEIEKIQNQLGGYETAVGLIIRKGEKYST